MQLKEVQASQKRLQLRVKNLKIRQKEQLREGAVMSISTILMTVLIGKVLREQARAHLFAIRRYGSGGMDQIRKREVYDVPLNEKLPTEFYSQLVDDLEAKSKLCIQQIIAVEQEMKLMMKARTNPSRSTPKEAILQIIRNQQSVIERLTTTIQRIHREIDMAKVKFITVRAIDSSLFDQEEKYEALNQRRKEQQLKEALAACKQPQPQSQQNPTSQQPSTGQQMGTATLGSITGSTGGGPFSTEGNAFSSAPTFGQPASTALTTFSGTSPSTFGGFSSSTPLNSMSMPSLTGGSESLVQAKMNRKKGASSRKY